MSKPVDFLSLETMFWEMNAILNILVEAELRIIKGLYSPKLGVWLLLRSPIHTLATTIFLIIKPSVTIVV